MVTFNIIVLQNSYFMIMKIVLKNNYISTHIFKEMLKPVLLNNSSKQIVLR